VFADTKTKVTSCREVSLSQFVFLDLQSTFKNFFGFRSSDCDMDSDLFVTTDTECSDSVSSFAYRKWLEIVSDVEVMAYCRLGFDHSIVPAPLRHE
jgi:Uri superfamily endonuclease